jgi:hypothetical protein
LEIGPSFGLVMHPDLGEACKVGSLKALGVCVPSLDVYFVEKGAFEGPLEAGRYTNTLPFFLHLRKGFCPLIFAHVA